MLFAVAELLVFTGVERDKFGLAFQDQLALTDCYFKMEVIVGNLKLPHSATLIELHSDPDISVIPSQFLHGSNIWEFA